MNHDLTDAPSSAVTFSVGANGTSTTYAGSIANGSGTISLTKTGTGTGSVSISGTPTAAYDVQVKIATTGEPGAATFQYSLDGGTTWSAAAAVPASGTVSLGDGLTVRFGDDGAMDLTAGDLFYVNAYSGGMTTDARIDSPRAALNNGFTGTVALDDSAMPKALGGLPIRYSPSPSGSR